MTLYIWDTDMDSSLWNKKKDDVDASNMKSPMLVKVKKEKVLSQFLPLCIGVRVLQNRTELKVNISRSITQEDRRASDDRKLRNIVRMKWRYRMKNGKNFSLKIWGPRFYWDCSTTVHFNCTENALPTSTDVNSLHFQCFSKQQQQ